MNRYKTRNTKTSKFNRRELITEVAPLFALPVEGDPLWSKGFPVVKLISEYLQESVDD